MKTVAWDKEYDVIADIKSAQEEIANLTGLEGWEIPPHVAKFSSYEEFIGFAKENNLGIRFHTYGADAFSNDDFTFKAAWRP